MSALDAFAGETYDDVDLEWPNLGWAQIAHVVDPDIFEDTGAFLAQVDRASKARRWWVAYQKARFADDPHLDVEEDFVWATVIEPHSGDTTLLAKWGDTNLYISGFFALGVPDRPQG